MSLLQSPQRVVRQIVWYVDNPRLESFPGAFLLAAGNLSRQLLEQILFILAFYSGMPRTKYLKGNSHLRMSRRIVEELSSSDPSTGLTYFQLAKRRGPRIAKFAWHPRSLERWLRLLNEPSHFRNPAAARRTREQHIREFVRRVSVMLDPLDDHLINAAVNEIKSGGTIRAILANDQANTPGVRVTSVIAPSALRLKAGRLSLRVPAARVQVVPDDKEVPIRWRNRVILVQHARGMHMEFNMVTKSGAPIDLSSVNALLASFQRTPEDQRALRTTLRRLGLLVERPNKRGGDAAI